MIVHLKSGLSKELITELASKTKSVHLFQDSIDILITSSGVKELPADLESHADSFHVSDSDIQLADRGYTKETRTIDLDTVQFGGDTDNCLLVTGPCSVESREQIQDVAKFITGLGLKTIRAGSYKPRTSPYSFQGLGLEGLKLLAEVREQYGLKVFSEVRDATHVHEIIEYADVVQIGAKSMYDHGILKATAKANKPVLLKRGFGTTLQEFVQCAEFILSGGNPNVVLCERGIRTFETKTRFTLDLCGVAYLKEYINLPIILDPSHAMGWAYGVSDLARSCLAMGVDGLLIETHPNPKVAKSDASQQLNFDQFSKLKQSLEPIASAIGQTIV